MPLSSIVIATLALLLGVLVFSYWAGGRVQEKYSDFNRDKVKYDKSYVAYVKNDPYQFIQKIFRTTRVIISESELLIIGRKRMQIFHIHMIGISSIVKISDVSSNKRSDSVIDLSYVNEAGQQMTVCLSGQDTVEILGYLKSKA